MALRIAKWICLQLRTGSPVYAIGGKLKIYSDHKDVEDLTHRKRSFLGVFVV